MRIWTIHPRYLDVKGLTALWRETLLAQKVLQGLTTGYRSHPQLVRLRGARAPVATCATYLAEVQAEATRRGYHFDIARIVPARSAELLLATRGQLLYEWDHLLAKLRERDPARWRKQRRIESPDPHPLFTIVEGGIEPWERI